MWKPKGNQGERVHFLNINSPMKLIFNISLIISNIEMKFVTEDNNLEYEYTGRLSKLLSDLDAF